MRKRKSNPRKEWTEDERQTMVNLFPDTDSKVLATKMNRTLCSIRTMAHTLGLKKSDEYLKEYFLKSTEVLKKHAHKTQFKKNHIPKNKGKKMPEDLKEKIKHTLFQKGNTPHNIVEVGTETIRKDTRTQKPYIFIKTTSGWQYKHRYLWEETHGTIPRGQNVTFLNGNSTDCRIENLRLLTDRELLIENHWNQYPHDLRDTIKILNKIKTQINEKQNTRS